MSKAILWFRQDLRLLDNKAFYHACEQHKEILPIFIWDENTPQKWQMGSAQKWWLYHSLVSLQKDLKEHGLDLYLRKGKANEILKKITFEHNIQCLYSNFSYEPYQKNQDEGLKNELLENQIEVSCYNSSLLCEPWQIQTKSGSPYSVFSQFWKAFEMQEIEIKVYPKPKKFPKLIQIKNEDLTTWNLLPTSPNWAKGFEKYWKIGEKAAQEKLKNFTQTHLENYAQKRDFPAINGTSKLSSHLHFGEISPHLIWENCKKTFKGNQKNSKGLETYLREIGWREFCYYLIYHNPDFPEKNFHKKFDKLKWEKDPKKLKAWQKGLTGYPIIDAAMRELWQTGWMHNRLRMVVGSFLTKHLQIHWMEGAKWFWDTLLDADLSNNSAGWQWVAGSGADAQPYFRIFNPIIQSKKFDPQGNFIRKWIPELAKLSNDEIHTPWEISKENLEKADIKLGKTYPFPIVDHKKAREKALKNFEATK